MDNYKVKFSAWGYYIDAGGVNYLRKDGTLEKCLRPNRVDYFETRVEAESFLKEWTKLQEQIEELEKSHEKLKEAQMNIISIDEPIKVGQWFRRKGNGGLYMVTMSGFLEYNLISGDGYRWDNATKNINDIFGGKRNEFERVEVEVRVK